MTKKTISPEDLKKLLGDNNLTILDSRWFLNESNRGYKEFKGSHIPNAIFFDINKNSDKTSDIPHMFPKKIFFEKFVNNNGISKKNQIVIYDQVGFFCSSRVWFMFKYFGYENTKILEEGFEGWVKREYETSKLIKKPKKKNKNKNF